MYVSKAVPSKIKKKPTDNVFQIHRNKDIPNFCSCECQFIDSSEIMFIFILDRDMHYSNKNSEFHYVSNEKCRDTLVPLWEFQQKVIFSKKLERQTKENIEMKGILDLLQIVDNWVHESGWDSMT